MMKRFIKDVKRYYAYAMYSAKSDLKDEVASSYLNWLWWILDPLLFMCVYTFIALVIFQKGTPYFPVFVFIGLTMWNFFSKTAIQCVKVVRTNKPIVSKVYLPKWVLIWNRVLVNGFKMLVSFCLVGVLMAIFHVPLTWNILWIFPIALETCLFTFGFCCFLLHFGVYVEDLYNVTNVFLKLLFYLTGIFYDISTLVKEPWRTFLLSLNPMSTLIQSARVCLLYEDKPYLDLLVIWLGFSLLLCIHGVRIIYQNENNYVKVM